jgi:hypothetical protein
MDGCRAFDAAASCRRERPSWPFHPNRLHGSGLGTVGERAGKNFMPKIILFTADDLGLDESTNLAIERAHRDGVLTCASFMLGQPGEAHALEIIRRNPRLEIGWHFHACDSKPLTCAEWPWGKSPARAGLATAAWPSARELIRREVAEQWKQFAATGVACGFINGHHHLHVHPFIAREIRRVVPASFAGWVRGFGVKFFSSRLAGRCARPFEFLFSPRWRKGWPTNPLTDTLWGVDRTFRMDAREVARVLPTLPEGRHEFIFHPRQHGDADERALLELKRDASFDIVLKLNR